MKKIYFVVLFAAIIGIGLRVALANPDAPQHGEIVDGSVSVTQPPAQEPVAKPPAFDKTQHSIDDPKSIWVIINKTRPLPDGYKPDDLVVPDTRLRLARSYEQMQLRAEPAEHLEDLIASAKAAGYNLALSSGYRGEALQKQFYDSYVTKDGVKGADTYSARPGFSEHQTGLAVDLGRVDQKCQLEICFGETAEGKWLAEHAHEFGFVVRYLEGEDDITGYQYEPWHLRYVGLDLAKEVQKQGKTLEEFFGLPAAPDYL